MQTVRSEKPENGYRVLSETADFLRAIGLPESTAKQSRRTAEMATTREKLTEKVVTSNEARLETIKAKKSNLVIAVDDSRHEVETSSFREKAPS